jgi:hypothetical protein
LDILIESNYSSSSSYKLVVTSVDHDLLFSSLVKSSPGKPVKVYRSNLAKGLIKISLLNSENEADIERLFFVSQEENKVDVNIIPTKNFYSPREKVELEIGLLSNNISLDSANLSISVLDENQFTFKDYFFNIRNHAHLIEDLRSSIDLSHFCQFINDNMNINDINLLLSMQEIKISKRKNLEVKRAEDLSVKGLVLSASGNPSKYASIIASIPENEETFLFTSANEDGKFEIPLDIEGSKDISLSAVSSTNPKETLTIKIEEKKVPVNDLKTTVKTDYKSLKDYYIQKAKLVRIEEAYKNPEKVEPSKVSETQKRKSEFEISANTVVELSRYQRFSTMKEVIQEIVPGFKFKKNKTGIEIFYR